MLVLSTYISELVDRNNLERLLKVQFLRSRSTSPSLQADELILTGVYRKIFLELAQSSPSTYIVIITHPGILNEIDIYGLPMIAPIQWTLG